ncbi:MAG TPA: hypothetical protein VFW75_11460 [Acetobacteraceae bacterium]|nr:hypothetical protein [Acetobacteraceae bacterium]
MSEARLHRWTLEEFLAWEEQQPAKQALVNGQPRLMVGVTQGHTRIVANIVITLGGRLALVETMLRMKEIYERLGFEPESVTL